MYRKEECLSLLKDPEEHEVDDENQDTSDGPPTLKWHKVMNISWEWHLWFDHAMKLTH